TAQNPPSAPAQAATKPAGATQAAPITQEARVTQPVSSPETTEKKEVEKTGSSEGKPQADNQYEGKPGNV
ncbi:MAG TPA: hypothetical protein PL001_02480, partial [Candidatus Kryptobacter bacterium]|nr:hypothetical protein [Candidatus Kryptobacter bacterium]